ncbi:Mycobacterium rhizamassiliense ORFan [Mycobacterium rhizamassiliense]|jgi:SAM-dependent methyltransferase|uniref:Mycobacterium rhizamassiliense ORFan n=1 Tax=Mycobacterium rhizamassiliense TaxID=1841860 RepID=A0A2U3NRD2_9MYCO|nr:Mycobacterium rhizamassiliense ORFan [Mycobacterium rhizamassiliense]
MSEPNRDWDAAYREEAPPPWSIGRPQPELAELIDQGTVRSDVLDSGCGHAALALVLAERGHTVVGLDASPTAIEAATAEAAERGLTTATFAQADVTDFDGYDGRFSTILDSGLFHALPPERRQDYLRSIFRAAAPGASLHILAFAAGALGDGGPRGFTENELRQEVSTLWEIDELRPAKVYGNSSALDADVPGVERDDEGHFMAPGFLLTAHKPELAAKVFDDEKARRPDPAPRRTLTIVACIIFAIASLGLAFMASIDLYLTGFPDSHFTDYDRAAKAPKRLLMWAEWGFVLVFLGLAFAPMRTRTRAIRLIIAVVVLVTVVVVQRVGVPWYFMTHLGLDNGIGG